MSPSLKNALIKYGLRFLTSLGIYVFFQITTAHEGENIFDWTIEDEAYLYFTIIVVMVIWEISDRIIDFAERRYLCTCYSVHKVHFFVIFWVDTLLLIPLILAVNYFSVYHLKLWLECPAVDPVMTFWKDSVSSLLIAWLVITSQLVKLNFKHVKAAENKAALMQKELLLSQYESLKNQVNPHFLFNSFSVLSSLIHQDPDLASDFLDKLSKLYRYMLDNKDNQMVTLQKEVEFMESYIFLLKARHENGISINIKLSLDQQAFYVPTLSLQMLIENAIKHNKFSKSNPLTIRIFNEGDDYLVVENELRAKKNEVQSTKVGLENIRKRYNYQSERRVIIAESDSHFTVKLPILSSIQFA
ncbi:MAG: histidine kinase [Cyclobacteriaceae bacterium]